MDLELDGVPGVTQVSVFVWPEPAGRPVRIGVDVVRLGPVILERPVTTGFELEEAERRPVAVDDYAVVSAEELEADLEEERPAIISLGTSEWLLCAQAGIQREVRDLDAHGRPLFHEVDTAAYCYKLVCPRCGRARYAKRNSIHQIKYCRVCTKQDRLRKRALDQYRERQRKQSDKPRKRLAPHVVDQVVELYQAGAKSADIARQLEVTPSAISKILKRRGLR